MSKSTQQTSAPRSTQPITATRGRSLPISQTAPQVPTLKSMVSQAIADIIATGTIPFGCPVVVGAKRAKNAAEKVINENTLLDRLTPELETAINNVEFIRGIRQHFANSGYTKVPDEGDAIVQFIGLYVAGEMYRMVAANANTLNYRSFLGWLLEMSQQMMGNTEGVSDAQNDSIIHVRTTALAIIHQIHAEAAIARESRKNNAETSASTSTGTGKGKGRATPSRPAAKASKGKARAVAQLRPHNVRAINNDDVDDGNYKTALYKSYGDSNTKAPMEDENDDAYDEEDAGPYSDEEEECEDAVTATLPAPPVNRRLGRRG